MTSRPAPRRFLPRVLLLVLAAACAGDTPPAGDAQLPDATTAAPGTPGDTAGGNRAPAASDRTGAAEVTVFFTRNEQPVPVTRAVPATVAVLGAALDALLAGPTETEQARGISSWFSAATAGMLLGVSVSDQGHAVVDFADFSTVIPNASTSAGSAMLLNELNHTVFQFDNVRSVEYRFEGDCTRFFEWLQLSCERIMRPA
jgi:spore germination protein GerM